MADQRILNGIDVPALEAALKTVGANPQAARAPKSSRVRWTSGLKFKAQVRNHAFVVDEPTHLTGEDSSPNSMEYVLGAYGACLATGFVLNATKRGITIHNMEIAVDSTQNNSFAFLGINDEGHPGFDVITAKLYVQCDADTETVQQIWEHSVRTSPVANSLTRNVELKTEVTMF
ncbi:MAG: OsmC family protein [Chloroflexota bacterium]